MPNVVPCATVRRIVGHRPLLRAPHQAIGLPLPHLVERRGAAGDEERAGQRVHQIDQRRGGTGAKRIRRRRRQQDEKIEARLRQRDEVARARMRAFARRPRRPDAASACEGEADILRFFGGDGDLLRLRAELFVPRFDGVGAGRQVAEHDRPSGAVVPKYG